MKANENKRGIMSKEDAIEDKARFVENLGWLLSQTRTGVTSCRLINDDIVCVNYGEGEQYINIAMDSYTAIIIDVAKIVI